MQTITNALSVDVEDYFQVQAFENQYRVADWPKLAHRVEANTHRLLELFAEHDVKATFFMLGWVAERYPQLPERVVAGGHELASHGWWHRRATEQDPETFYQDVSRAKAFLEDRIGAEVSGYRAPSYSIEASNRWAWAQLARAGYRYSSSVYPVEHDLYGMPDAPRFAFYPDEAPGLLELPVTTVELGPKKLPAGGGGYFRLLPYRVSRQLIRTVNRKDGQPAIFYMHPWEIDPAQPRTAGASAKSRFRHYLNLHRTEPRLRRLLGDFNWDRVDRVFADQLLQPVREAA